MNPRTTDRTALRTGISYGAKRHLSQLINQTIENGNWVECPDGTLPESALLTAEVKHVIGRNIRLSRKGPISTRGRPDHDHSFVGSRYDPRPVKGAPAKIGYYDG